MLMTDEEKHEMYMKNIAIESQVCAKIAFLHQNSKDTVRAFREKAKEVKERIDIKSKVEKEIEKKKKESVSD